MLPTELLHLPIAAAFFDDWRVVAAIPPILIWLMVAFYLYAIDRRLRRSIEVLNEAREISKLTDGSPFDKLP